MVIISTYWGEFFCGRIARFVKLVLVLEGNLSLTLGNTGDEIEKGINVPFIE